MIKTDNISRPTKEEQRSALESYNALEEMLEKLQSKNPEVTITETQDKIEIPMNALKLLVKILKATGEGKPVSIVPIETEMTTQAAAELIGCSRPHFVKLLEEGEIEYTKIGRHRRVKFEDVQSFKNDMKIKQKALLTKIIRDSENLGLYDS